MDKYERMWVADQLYKREYGSDQFVYFCPEGLKLLHYKPVKRDGEWDKTCKLIDIYTWKNFKVTHFYFEKNSNRKGIIKKYSFILNDIPWFDKTWKEMINIIQDYTLDTPPKRNLLLKSLNQYLDDPVNEITELKVADVIGFVPPNENLPQGGWQMPDQFYFVSGNDFREDIEENIRDLCNYKMKEDLDIKNLFKRMYDVTSIDYKDYIFAYGLVAPFLFALRSITKIMPLLALGGPGGKGKTAIEEFFTVKMWGNIDEIIGSALMDTKPRVQGTLTGSTIPVCIDDCEDLKEFVTGILKRMVSFGDRVKKLNPDQTKKMDCEYCSPSMMSFNALPVMFQDPAFRQRIVMLFINNVKENEEWLEVYNSIPKKAIGKYILEQTKDLTFKELVKIYKSMSNMGVKTNRQKAIVRLMLLGKHFAKEWFDIDLDLSHLPEILKKTLMAGNEEIMDLIQTQIKQSDEIFVNEDGGLENPNKKSWVNFPVLHYKHHSVNGYIYTSENCLDLAQRLGRKKRNFSIKNVAMILETQWETIVYGSFYTPQTKSPTTRGIFIPLTELDGTRALIENAEEIEEEINQIAGDSND